MGNENLRDNNRHLYVLLDVSRKKKVYLSLPLRLTKNYLQKLGDEDRNATYKIPYRFS